MSMQHNTAVERILYILHRQCDDNTAYTTCIPICWMIVLLTRIRIIIIRRLRDIIYRRRILRIIWIILNTVDTNNDNVNVRFPVSNMRMISIHTRIRCIRTLIVRRIHSRHSSVRLPIRSIRIMSMLYYYDAHA